MFPLTEPGAVFAVLFLLVLLGPVAAQRARLPALVGLIVAGMLVGPNMFGILGQNTFIETLAYIGLLYLMFEGGLDLDFQGFIERPRDSLIFGVLTFALPFLLVIATARLFQLGWIAAVILGVAFASHTLLSYPTVSRFHLSRNRAVTATLGATLFANTVALMVLAVAVAAERGDTTVFAWVTFVAGFGAYIGVMVTLVPRLTRWFFTGVGQDRHIRLAYLLSGMGVSAVLAQALGIEPIVGAFFAGLAFNRFVPHGTPIAQRVKVLGESVFIPAFLISTGMLLDPLTLFTSPTSLVYGAVFTVVLVASKLLAADLAGRISGVGPAERGVMFSLSVGQAAGALAAAVIGRDLGVIDEPIVNAVILVILASALFAGMSADRYAPNVPHTLKARSALGSRVIVPVSNPDSVKPLVRIAAQLASADSGAVVAINVLGADASQAQRSVNQGLLQTAEDAALAAGAEAVTTVRIDASPVEGVLHTVVEQDGTALVVGWKGFTNAREGLFGSVIDQLVQQSPVPVLVCRPGVDERTQRIVAVITDSASSGGDQRAIDTLFAVARRLQRQTDAPFIVLTDSHPDTVHQTARKAGVVAPAVTQTKARPLADLAGMLRVGDVVLTTSPIARDRISREARQIARIAMDRTVVVVLPR
jgi:Kef-type K+ transport system membrane component KefB/nucleotide-binding universal stress UspA family protein